MAISREEMAHMAIELRAVAGLLDQGALDAASARLIGVGRRFAEAHDVDPAYVMQVGLEAMSLPGSMENQPTLTLVPGGLKPDNEGPKSA